MAVFNESEMNLVGAMRRIRTREEGRLKRRAEQIERTMLAEGRARLTGPRSGRFYPLPGGGQYQASAPGEFPAEKTGALRADTTVHRSESTTPGGYAAIIWMEWPHIEYLAPLNVIRPFVDRLREELRPLISATAERVR